MVTCTGAKNVIDKQHFKLLKNGCFLINVGHADKEININFLYNNYKHHTIRPHVEHVDVINEDNQKKKTVYVFANGSMCNLVAGFGDSINAFDITLAAMVNGVGFIVTKG